MGKSAPTKRNSHQQHQPKTIYQRTYEWKNAGRRKEDQTGASKLSHDKVSNTMDKKPTIRWDRRSATPFNLARCDILHARNLKVPLTLHNATLHYILIATKAVTDTTFSAVFRTLINVDRNQLVTSYPADLWGRLSSIRA